MNGFHFYLVEDENELLLAHIYSNQDVKKPVQVACMGKIMYCQVFDLCALKGKEYFGLNGFGNILRI